MGRYVSYKHFPHHRRGLPGAALLERGDRWFNNCVAEDLHGRMAQRHQSLSCLVLPVLAFPLALVLEEKSQGVRSLKLPAFWKGDT